MEYDLETFLLSSPLLFSITITYLGGVYDCAIILFSVISIIFIGEKSLKRINSILSDLFPNNIMVSKLKLNNIQIHTNVKQFIEEHNQFCQTLLEFNRFWSKIYISFMLLIFPINLMLLHQLILEQVDLSYRIILAFTSIVLTLDFYLIQYCLANISTKIHKMTKILARLQWRLNRWPFRLNNKIKLMTYFERLSSDRKIGITIGPTVVLTVQVFNQVLILKNKIFLIIFFIDYHFIGYRSILSLFYSHS